VENIGLAQDPYIWDTMTITSTKQKLSPRRDYNNTFSSFRPTCREEKATTTTTIQLTRWVLLNPPKTLSLHSSFLYCNFNDLLGL
jgi:hypothetical protein